MLRPIRLLLRPIRLLLRPKRLLLRLLAFCLQLLANLLLAAACSLSGERVYARQRFACSLTVEEYAVRAVRVVVALVEKVLVALLIVSQPADGTHGEAIFDGDDEDFVLPRALGIDGRSLYALRSLISESRGEFFRKLFLFVRFRFRQADKDFAHIDIRSLLRQRVVVERHGHLVLVEIDVNAALLQDVVSELIDFLVVVKLLLQLREHTQSEHLRLRLRQLVVPLLHLFGDGGVEGSAYALYGLSLHEACEAGEGSLAHNFPAQACRHGVNHLLVNA